MTPALEFFPSSAPCEARSLNVTNYKLNFIMGMYVKEKNIVYIEFTAGHPLGVLGYMPCGKGEDYCIRMKLN